MIVKQEFIDKDLRYLLIDLFNPSINACDFLAPKYDEALKGILYRPDLGYSINYSYSKLNALMKEETENPARMIVEIMKEKPLVKTSIDFRDSLDKVSEEEQQDQIDISEDMEKIAEEELSGENRDCLDGKSFELGED